MLSRQIGRLASRTRNQTMKVAVEGCCHGELDKIYDHIATLERKNNYKVDLLLICGDFQAIRNHADLQCMAVPQKYRQLGGFHKYYLGRTMAPILTIVIGGNHEASNYMWELYHGGWLAPNIYFLGLSGCVQVNGVRIAGSSGIYNSNHYNLGHNETVPYDNSSIRSIYHTRLFDIFKLSHLSLPDIFLSHDWPNTIEQHGDLQGLLRRKPFFRQECETGSLGSPPLLDLLKKIKPLWWFSAHLHTKFEALYNHNGVPTKPPGNPDEIVLDDLEEDGDPKQPIENPDEIRIDDNEDFDVEPSASPKPVEPVISTPPEKAATAPGHQPSPRETRFLALDKCLPKRDFLQVIDIATPSFVPQSQSPHLTFDPEWLAITRAFHPFFSTTRMQVALPKPDDARTLVTTEMEWVRQNVSEAGLQEVAEVQKFWRTAPGPSGNTQGHHQHLSWYTNPQTEAFARLLQIPNKVNPVPEGMVPPLGQGATEEETSGETMVSASADADADTSALALRRQDGEMILPKAGENVNEGTNMGEGGVDDVPSDAGMPPGMTYPEEPTASGGWSPSRIMS